MGDCLGMDAWMHASILVCRVKLPNDCRRASLSLLHLLRFIVEGPTRDSINREPQTQAIF